MVYQPYEKMRAVDAAFVSLVSVAGETRYSESGSVACERHQCLDQCENRDLVPFWLGPQVARGRTAPVDPTGADQEN